MSISPAETYLKDQGHITRSSPQRRQLLGCLGCRLSRQSDVGATPEAYGYQIMKCTGMKAGVVFPLLGRLEAAGVIQSSREEINASVAGTPPRRLYRVAETSLGEEFAATLIVPAECNLESLRVTEDQ